MHLTTLIRRAIPVLALSLLLPAASWASGNVAVISARQAILNTDAAQKRLKEIQATKDFSDGRAQLTNLQKDGQALVERLRKDGVTMKAEDRQQAEGKLRQIQSDIQYQSKRLQDQQDQGLQTVVEQLLPRFRDITRSLIEQEKIGLLLDVDSGVVLHADSAFDITAKVTDRLNRGQ